MVPDVMPISGTSAVYAVRLCNFKTGLSNLLYKHTVELETNAKPLITGPGSCSVEIIGLASHRGDARHFDNKGLSMNRINAVKNLLSGWQPKLTFKKLDPEGSSTSTGPAENDDGYWRAVEVFIFCSKAAPAPKDPDAPKQGLRWKIRVISGQVGGLTVPLVDAGVGGWRMILEIVDLDRKRKAQFRSLSAGFQLPSGSAFPNFVPLQADETQILGGGFTSFSTRVSAELEDFQGDIKVHQDPGANSHRASMAGGNFSIVFEHLPELLNTTVPRILSVNTANPVLMVPKVGGGMASVAGTVKLVTFPEKA